MHSLQLFCVCVKLSTHNCKRIAQFIIWLVVSSICAWQEAMKREAPPIILRALFALCAHKIEWRNTVDFISHLLVVLLRWSAKLARLYVIFAKEYTHSQTVKQRKVERERVMGCKLGR